MAAIESSSSFDVVVIGGGLAGLACARALKAGGLDAVVLEARERLGGRVHSVDVDGVDVELGAQWVHDDAASHPARKFAERANLKLRGTSWEQAALVSRGERRPGAEIKRARAAAERAFGAARATRRTAKADASLDDALRPLLAGADAVTQFFVRLENELDYGAGAEQLSLHHWDKDEYWREVKSSKKGGDALAVGPLSSAVAALSEGLDVRLGHAVTAVETGDDAVRVRGDAFELTTRRVVVAVPLGVLKRGTPEFSPALSQRKTHALTAVGFSRFEKVVLAFAEPFWERVVGRRHVIHAPTDAAAAAPRFEVFFSLNAARGTAEAPHVLVAIVGGSDATAAEAEDDETLRLLVCDALDAALGTSEAARHCRRMLRTRWSRDEFSRGAYSYLPPGATPDDYDALARPEHRGRVLFCGEHTSRKYPATMHGALLSGEREAKRILGDLRP
jgi:monoamine oxidase